VRLHVLVAPLVLAGCTASPAAPDAFDATDGAPAPGVAADEPSPADPWSTLATSVEGRPVRHATFGHGPRRMLWVGGIHGDEREGAHATAELAAAFAAEHVVPAPHALDQVTLVVIEDLNPDGTARGTRTNANGVDLNRNFPAPSFQASSRHGAEPLSEPEARALAELVAGWRPELVLVAHSWRGQEFVNFDGPARDIAERFAAASGFDLRASDELAPTPGSFGSWAGATLGIPVLTIEWRRGRDPVEAWERTRAAILGAIAGP
jgi:predicted deacylase